MPQEIRGVIGSVDNLRGQVEGALRARRMSWTRLAEGTPYTRQYLRQTVFAPVVPLDVLTFLAGALNLQLRVNVAPTVSPLLQPSPDSA